MSTGITNVEVGRFLIELRQVDSDKHATVQELRSLVHLSGKAIWTVLFSLVKEHQGKF